MSEHPTCTNKKLQGFSYEILVNALRFTDKADIPCPACSPYRKPIHQNIKCLRVWRMDAPLLSFHCVHCGESGVVWKDGETYVPDDRMLERMRRERERHRKEEEKRRLTTARDNWKAARPGRGTLADSYFRRRGLTVPDEFWKWIRYHPAMFFGAADRELPCVVLPMRAFDNPRSLRGVHLIALANDALNYKHDGHSLKISRGLLLGRAAVMTAPAGPDLCLCEGFETALGILMLGKNDGAPVWATTGREFLAAVPPLPDVTGKLIICADNDTSRDGLASARKLRRVWLKDSEADEVRLLWPSREGTDYADEATTKTDGRKPCPKKSQNESVWPTN